MKELDNMFDCVSIPIDALTFKYVENIKFLHHPKLNSPLTSISFQFLLLCLSGDTIRMRINVARVYRVDEWVMPSAFGVGVKTSRVFRLVTTAPIRSKCTNGPVIIELHVCKNINWVRTIIHVVINNKVNQRNMQILNYSTFCIRNGFSFYVTMWVLRSEADCNCSTQPHTAHFTCTWCIYYADIYDCMMMVESRDDVEMKEIIIIISLAKKSININLCCCRAVISLSVSVSFVVSGVWSLLTRIPAIYDLYTKH